MSLIAKAHRLPPSRGGLIAKERRLQPCGCNELAKERRLDKSANDFGRSIRAAARILWRGEGELYDFVDALNSAIFRGYEQAWREGAATCHMLPEDRTLEERAVLADFVNVAHSRILPLAEFITNNSKANGGKWGALQSRLSIWTNRYSEIVERAKAMSCQDIKEEWVYGDTVKHCADCSRVVGRVYRASIWNKYGWFPRSRNLACGGWHCGCHRDPTDKPVTPGRPPNLSGQH